jgi:hypothetical protein
VPLRRLSTSLSLSRDPLAYASRAIPELDAARFATVEKSNRVSIHEGQIREVEQDGPVVAFGLEKFLQFIDMLCVHPTNQLEHNFPVCGPLNLQHLNLEHQPCAPAIEIHRRIHLRFPWLYSVS